MLLNFTGSYRVQQKPASSNYLARQAGKTLFVLFVDFAKAFDTVPRPLLWKRLAQLGVPSDLIQSVCKLYQKVLVKINPDDAGVDSTLGVIQGCPASPTLFGLDTRLYTCNTAVGDSVVDYLLASDAGRVLIEDFVLEPFVPESDHRPIRFSLRGFDNPRRIRGKVRGVSGFSMA
ncbi:hypothetical protein R1sor_001283 [Riccia sorocarpa]|uniref:Reverse transcriptase domain-containing protein n=1 Tax=Riccia sorocarpa TaxID=122646 RepID=A0ABD3GZP5_9MARC